MSKTRHAAASVHQKRFGMLVCLAMHLSHLHVHCIWLIDEFPCGLPESNDPRLLAGSPGEEKFICGHPCWLHSLTSYFKCVGACPFMSTLVPSAHRKNLYSNQCWQTSNRDTFSGLHSPNLPLRRAPNGCGRKVPAPCSSAPVWNLILRFQGSGAACQSGNGTWSTKHFPESTQNLEVYFIFKVYVRLKGGFGKHERDWKIWKKSQEVSFV